MKALDVARALRLSPFYKSLSKEERKALLLAAIKNTRGKK